jgi:hypothetical protein
MISGNRISFGMTFHVFFGSSTQIPPILEPVKRNRHSSQMLVAYGIPWIRKFRE